MTPLSRTDGDTATLTAPAEASEWTPERHPGQPVDAPAMWLVNRAGQHYANPEWEAWASAQQCPSYATASARCEHRVGHSGPHEVLMNGWMHRW